MKQVDNHVRRKRSCVGRTSKMRLPLVINDRTHLEIKLFMVELHRKKSFFPNRVQLFVCDEVQRWNRSGFSRPER